MSKNIQQMIANAQSAYIRCIDDDRLEEWPSHFHGTCFYKITTAANEREGLGRHHLRQLPRHAGRPSMNASHTGIFSASR
jgi:3-phenylpropionate/cinnamic acid dioxygenase small subunit